MAQDLVFDLELSLDAAHAKLDSMLARTQGKAKSAGSNAGTGFGNAFAQIAGSIIATISFSSLLRQGNAWIAVATEVEDQMSDVAKTTNLTGVELKKLEDGIDSYGKTTRTSNKELRAVSEEVGRLGVEGGENILAFTKSIDKLNVALGDEFAGGAQEITKQVGSIINVFSDLQKGNREEAILKVGNALNVVASKTAATAPVLTDYTNRIGGLAPDLLAGNILGIAAALEEMGVPAERGGSAVGRLVMQMKDTKTIGNFAKFTNMTVEEFKNLVNTSPNDALLKVAESTRQFGDDSIALNSALTELKITGVGEVEVLQKLGNNTDKVRTSQVLANEALGNTNSIMDEYGKKNNNAAAENLKFANSLETNNKKMGEALIPIKALVMEGLTPLIEAIGRFAEANPTAFSTLAVLTAGMVGLLVVITSGMLLFNLFTPLIATIGVQFGVAGASAAGASGAMATLGATFTFLTGPIGLIILAVFGLIGMFTLLYTKVDWFRGGVNSAVEQMKGYFGSWSGNVGERVAEIIGFFLTLPIKLPLIMADAIEKIIAYLSNGDNWAKAWEGLTNSFSTALKWIEEQWKKIDFKAILRGLINGATKGTPLEGQTFGFSGGGYTGDGNPRAAAGIVHKNEAVLNPRQMSDLIFGIAKMGASSNQTNNNTTNYYGMDVNSGFKNPAFI